MFTLYNDWRSLEAEIYIRGTAYADMSEMFKIFAIEEESVSQSSFSQKEVFQLEVTFHQWNTTRMEVDRYNVSVMTGLSREG